MKQKKLNIHIHQVKANISKTTINGQSNIHIKHLSTKSEVEIPNYYLAHLLVTEN